MRKVFKALITCLVVIIACAATSVLYAGDKDKIQTGADNIIVLRSDDPTPPAAEKIKNIQLGTTVLKPSYFEFVAEAKAAAREYNANVVKIIETVPAAGAKRPLQAILYKAENTRALEREFAWNKNRRLSWDDFRGAVPHTAGDETAAATFCGIGFETNSIHQGDKDLKIHVYNSFYTKNSWARPEEKDSLILAHEQGHFDICELYTRKLRERLSKIKPDNPNLKHELGTVYQALQREYNDRQQEYELETSHGVVLEEQEKWNQMLASELSRTETWME